MVLLLLALPMSNTGTDHSHIDQIKYFDYFRSEQTKCNCYNPTRESPRRKGKNCTVGNKIDLWLKYHFIVLGFKKNCNIILAYTLF
jgi:hypothetical protein